MPEDNYQYVETEFNEAEEGGSSAWVSKTIKVLVLLVQNRRLLAMTTGAALLVGIALHIKAPERYTSMARIMTPQNTPAESNMLGTSGNGQSGSIAAIGTGAGGMFGMKNPNAIYVALLGSSRVGSRIVAKFDLLKVYHASSLAQARAILAGSTRIDLEESGLIAISVTDPDKKRAADIANDYAIELHQLAQDMAVTEATQRRMFAQAQLKDAQEQLEKAGSNFAVIQKQKGIYELDSEVRTVSSQLSEIQGKIASKQIEISTLKMSGTAMNPNVREAEAQLAALQVQAGELKNKTDLQKSGRIGFLDVTNGSSEYMAAEKELEYRRTVYDALLKQADTAHLDELKDRVIVQVVDEAIPAEHKNPTNRSKVVMQFALCGFLAGCAFIYIRGFLQKPEIVQAVADLRSSMASSSQKSK